MPGERRFNTHHVLLIAPNVPAPLYDLPRGSRDGNYEIF
jgi:hypothetical protein